MNCGQNVACWWSPPESLKGETEEIDTNNFIRDVGIGGDDDDEGPIIKLAHRLQHDQSILALAVSSRYIYAGTEGGQILVYSLDTFKRLAAFDGHKGSVLDLYLSDDQSLLFSSAGDRFVNVWDTKNLNRVFSIYSTYDVGDIFCIAYSNHHKTIYLGAQNTTIQWYDLKEKDKRPLPTPGLHPYKREDRFFDSPGPGGVRTPKPGYFGESSIDRQGGQDLELDRRHVKHFAHYGYVYCMLLTKDIYSEDYDREILISGGGDGLVKVWRPVTATQGDLQEVCSLDDGREEGHSVLSLAIDGTFLYSGRTQGEINVWDLETRQLVRSLKLKHEDILTLSVGGGHLFVGTEAGKVEHFDQQYERVTTVKAHTGRVLTSAYSRVTEQRSLYITGGSDSSITIWNVQDVSLERSSTRKTSNERMVEALRQLVSYRTVSSDTRYQSDCRRGASHLRSVLKNFGAQTTMLAAPNSQWNPIILARFHGNPATRMQRKTIMFYGHYDVIGADMENTKWKTDPFAMEGINDYLYGRGTSDNKGPIVAAIFAVAELVAEKALDSDIVFLIEGEEESGSRGFERAVKDNKELIGDIDWLLVANSYWLDDHTPCLTYGLRGVIHATLEISSNHPDLHSGVDGSSLLDESLKDLVNLLATLNGENGRIEIPGFYDPIPKLTKEEQQLYRDITRALTERNPSLGDPEQLAESLQRRWREASLTVHRFHTSGPENSTIIPRLARAAISIRLVPNQEARTIAASLTEHLKQGFARLNSSNKLTVTIDHMAEPWLGDFTNEIFKTLEEAIVEAWSDTEQYHKLRRNSSSQQVTRSVNTGNTLPCRRALPAASSLKSINSPKPSPTTSSTLATGSITPPIDPLDLEPSTSATDIRPREPSIPSSQPTSSRRQIRKPLYIREGGSIPAIRFLEKEFGAPAAHLPCGQASDSAHLDNERLRLVNLYKSKDIFKKVFAELPRR